MAVVLFLMPTKTYRATAFLSAAEKLKIEAVVATEKQQALQPFAPDKNLTLNFNHRERAVRQIIDFAKEKPLDAVIPVDDDTAVIATLAAKALSLRHNSPEAAAAAREKHKMRRLLSESGLNSPKIQLIDTDTNPWGAAQQTEFPCVLKPLFLASSRGVIRANSIGQFADAFERITSILKQPDVQESGRKLAAKILVEEYITGKEVALEGLLTDGDLNVLAIFDKPDPMNGPYFEETIYVTPSRHSEDIQDALARTTSLAADAMGIRHGPVHAELRINETGIWLIEIAARSIGGLCSQALRFENGISLEEVILRHAVGEDVQSVKRENRAAGVMMIPIPKAGTLKNVQGLEKAHKIPGVEDIKITIALTQKVVPLPEGNRYLGFIFAREETPEGVETALRTAHDTIEFTIE